jgi:hypothetical protein
MKNDVIYQVYSKSGDVSSYLGTSFGDDTDSFSMQRDPNCPGWSQSAKGEGVVEVRSSDDIDTTHINFFNGDQITCDHSELVELYVALQMHFDNQPERNQFALRKMQVIL